MNDEIIDKQKQIKKLKKKIRGLENNLDTIRNVSEKVDCELEIEELEEKVKDLEKELNALQKPPVSFRQESVHLKMQPWRFDMQQLTRPYRDEIRYKTKGVIGIAIKSPVPKFLENLRERLLYDLNFKNVCVPSSLYTLNEKVEPTDRVLERLKKYKKDLQEDDVFIILPIITIEADQVNLFWYKLCQEFDKQIEHRLVVIFGGTPESPFPEPLNPLAPPCFNKEDISEWMREFWDSLNWPEFFFNDWWENMFNCCKNENNENLDVFEVFVHIEDILKTLQQCNCQPEPFFKKLYSSNIS